MIPTNGRGFTIKAESSGGESKATLHLYDAIGVDPWTQTGVSAAKLIEELNALGDVESLEVRINSPGGEVFEGLTIYNALARFKAPVTVHVDGIAASVASVIAMAGDRIVIAENAMFMVHRPFTIALGDAVEMRRVADYLDKTWTSILSTYQRRTGKRAATIEQKVQSSGGEWWMTAADAVQFGFADESAAPEREVQAFGLSRFKCVPERLAASAAKDATPRIVELPEGEEIAPPRVETPLPVNDLAAARAKRERIVEVLRAES